MIGMNLVCDWVISTTPNGLATSPPPPPPPCSQLLPLAARTAAESVPNCSDRQYRFALDRHRFAVDGSCACVFDYGLEDLCELRFALPLQLVVPSFPA
jgi:hypothetical protein